jgi:hypothetical protein
MNDMTVTTGTALAVIPAASLPTILAADETDIFGTLFRELNGFRGDASTERGRKEIITKAAKVSTAKQDLLRLGKKLKEEHLRIQRSVVAEEKVIEDRFDALRDQIRAPVTLYENREKERVAGHEAALATIAESPGYGETESAADLEQRLDYLMNFPTRDWQEFTARAKLAVTAEVDRTAGLLLRARKREAEAAELVRLRILEADEGRKAEHRAALKTINDFLLVPHERELTADEIRVRLDRLDNLPARDWEEFTADATGMLDVVRRSVQSWLDAAQIVEDEAQRLREEKIAAEAAERATLEAEEAAERKADEARQAAQAALDAAEVERLAGVERERLAAEELVAAAERERVAKERRERERVEAHERALASIGGMIRDACSPFNDSGMIRHVTKIMDGMQEITRDFEEFAERAETLITTGRQQIADRLAVVEGHEAAAREQKRHEEHLAEERRQEAARAQNELDRLAAIEAERARVAREAEAQRVVDERRAADVAHRGKINRAALTGVMAVLNDNWKEEDELSPEVLARKVVEAIAKNLIPNVSIKY